MRPDDGYWMWRLASWRAPRHPNPEPSLYPRYPRHPRSLLFAPPLALSFPVLCVLRVSAVKAVSLFLSSPSTGSGP